MENRAHFYSIYDMGIPSNLQRADFVVESYKAGWRPQDAHDVIELYNIGLFVENGVPKKGWTEETLQLINQDFKKEVVAFFSELKRNTWAPIFRQLSFDEKRSFWAILDRFNFDGLLDVETIRFAIAGSSWELQDLLRRERLVSKNQSAVIELLKENEHAAEWLLQEYVQSDASEADKRLFFPSSLSFQDKEDIISHYLDSPEPNLNYVRLVLVAKKDANLRLSDQVRLKANRVERRLNDNYFPTEHASQLTYSVRIDGSSGKPLKWVEQGEGGFPVLCYSKEVMRRFKGAELLHYIRFGFEFLSVNGMITLVAKDSDAGVFERFINTRGKYSYPTNFAFKYHEAISLLQIIAMQEVLKEEETSIEASVKTFYEKYLKEKFGYPSGVLSLADPSVDWVNKCRAIASEIDAIARRYDLYAKSGSIDEDLLMLSSENIRVTSAKSANASRYYSIKGKPGELLRLFYLFFSDQSMLTFIDPFKDSHYTSFYQLLAEQDGKICYKDYQRFQLQDIDFLVEKGYLSIGKNGMLYGEKFVEIGLLKQLYEYHSCPFQIFDGLESGLLSEMEQKGWVEIDNHLLSVEERNYFDYYMYNAQYTNGPALRNRYVHGCHADASKESVHRNAYYRLLILLIIELLKIEDDLITRQLAKKPVSESKVNLGKKAVILASIAEVGTYAYAQSKLVGEEYLKVPKKYGAQDGYVYLEREGRLGAESFSYYIKPRSGVLAEYISFFLNTSLIRLSVSQNSLVPVSLTMEIIKAISLPLVPLAEQRDYARLEHVLAPLFAKGSGRDRDENLEYNVLSTLREYLCLEIIKPEFTKKNDLAFIDSFKDMMSRLRDTDDENLPMAILRTIFLPGNPLMDNMKKARVILTEESYS